MERLVWLMAGIGLVVLSLTFVHEFLKAWNDEED